jgi:hypothetical protein
MPEETTEQPELQPARRFIYVDRRVCSITPTRIDVHPARSIIILPLITLILGLAAFPIIFFGGDSVSVPVRMGLTIFALFLVPLSGLGVVYSIAGAHIVVDKAKQSAVLQQGYLGMGVGTQELIPFWKMDRMRVEELTPHDYRGHQQDFAQYEVNIVKVSGKHIPVCTVTTRRADAEEGLSRAREVASLIAEMAGVKAQMARPRSVARVSASGHVTHARRTPRSSQPVRTRQAPRAEA